MSNLTTNQVRRLLLALTAAVALCLAAGSVSHAAAASSATVKTRHGKLGTFLVDGKGRTLYLFQKDKRAKSTCDDDCAEAWPPLLTTGKVTASGSARQDLIGTITRADGTIQVTYNDHPVYRFVKDKKAGDTKGQAVRAFGAKWYVMTRGGRKIGGY
jgi:predicted lipoprotein with Yx(FWY)xxD motif